MESHVFGVARGRITDTSVSANTGVTPDEYWESRSSFWATYYSAERFPTMTWIWENQGFEQPLGEDLHFGLAAAARRRRAAGHPLPGLSGQGRQEGWYAGSAGPWRPRAFSASRIAGPSIGISRWSARSVRHFAWSVMLVVLSPVR